MISRRLTVFARALRRGGVPVCPAEAADAGRALRRVGALSREDFRLALRACLVKEQRFFPLFDGLFERHFTVRLPGAGDGKKRRRGGAPGPAGAEPAGKSDRPGTGPPPAAPRPGEPAGGRPAGPGTPPAEPEQERRRRRRRRARALVARLLQAEERGSAEKEVAEPSGGRPVPDLRRLDLRRPHPPEQARSLEEEVRKLALRLVSREALRRRRAWRGRVDLRRTLARAARTGGVPFVLARRRRAVTHWQLCLLCDVSGSMRRAAGLFLSLAHAMQSLFARTRTFLFVDRPVDATGLFSQLPAEEALAAAPSLPGLHLEALSDYGSAFYRFLAEQGGRLDRHTVLVVLGDARTNRFDPQAWALEEIRQRVRRILWLNPEPAKLWGSEDSAAAAYRPFCDDFLPCGSLEELALAGDRIVGLGRGF